MTELDLREAPLDHPDQDLLAVAPHAQMLAEFLGTAELPFTVGIYGAWGSGKTTFANLLVHYLRGQPGWSDLRYIPFSAWPYVTADAIWRALLERIAREVYRQDPRRPDDITERADWISRLRTSLLADALPRGQTVIDPDRERYEALLARFDRAAALANRSHGQSAAATASLVGALADAIAMIAPGIGPLRSLLGGFQGDGQPGTADSSAPEVAKSVEELREDLRRLFADVTTDPIVVLLDDLDRSLPEVALDVLETIKVFFFESSVIVSPGASPGPLLFLVCADERLIARGLQARLGGDSAPDDKSIDARAYLEKIVQLGVALPESDVYGPQQLVAAWQPEWTAAADLIDTALEGNPRRIKQQCTLLSYHFHARARTASVAELDRVSLDESEQAVLNKLTRLSALSSTGIEAIAQNPEASSQELERLERAPNGVVEETDAPEDKSAKGTLSTAFAGRTEAVRWLRGDPRLSAYEPHALAILADFACARPGENGQPRTRDAVFSYILRAVVDQDGLTPVRRLHLAFMQRLLRLGREAPKLSGAVRRLAQSSTASYAAVTAELDAWIDARVAGLPSIPLSPRTRRIAAVCEPLATDQMGILTLTQSPRLSEIPVEHIRWLASVGRRASRSRRETSAALAALTDADRLLDRFDTDHLDAVVAPRLALALDLLERRKFVKVQLLQARWPELAGLARGRHAARRLQTLERTVLARPDSPEAEETYAEFRNDRQLRDFLRIPPSFADLYGTEVESLAAAPGAAPPESAPEQPLLTPQAGPVAEPYEELALRLDNTTIDEGNVATFQVSVMSPGEVAMDLETTLALGPIEERLQLATELYRTGGSGPQVRDVRAVGPTADEVMTDVGQELWNATFGRNRDFEEALLQGLEGPDRLRVVVTTDERRLASLPWEALFLPGHGLFAGQNLRMSVIRTVEAPPQPARRRPARPLRILVAGAQPRTTAPLPGVAQEIETLARILERAIADGIAQFQVLEQATWEELQRALRTFEPHVLHFVGHGVVQHGVGYVILVDAEGEMHPIDARDFGLTLQDRGILLAVLNGCATGSTETSDLAGGVAQVLVRRGVPAAIATTRIVLDDSAVRFAREFYRALVDGYEIERAMVDARNALAVKDWDWSAYVMYASQKYPLHDIRISEAARGDTAGADVTLSGPQRGG